MTSRGWFGALGTPKSAKRAGWRRLVYGRGNPEGGLYATLATPEHGAIQVEVSPDREGGAPKVTVRLTRYAGVGPEEARTLLEATL